MSDTEFRSRHVGASEVAALFDCHPRLTAFQLYHRKRGTIPEEDFAENERAHWGQLLEPVILAEACTRYGWTRDRARKRHSNGAGLGGHMDGSAIDPDKGPGIVETKTVDRLIYRDWGDEPPLNYLLQLTTYMGLSGRSWGSLVALVGGNELKRWDYEFRPKLFAEIEKRVADFWRAVETGDEPAPDYGKEAQAVIQAYGWDDGSALDLSHDNYVGELIAKYREGKAMENAGSAQADTARAELFHKFGAATTVTAAGLLITAKRTSDSPGTLIKPEHVGTFVGARAGSRRLNIKELTPNA